MALLRSRGRRCLAFRLASTLFLTFLAEPITVSANDCGSTSTTPNSQFVSNPAPPSLGEFATEEGDIITCRNSDLQEVAPSPRGFAISSTDRRWPYGVVPYTISAELGESSVKFIQNAIAHWNESSVTLVPISASANESHISFEPGSGCASWLGHRGGKQEVIVSGACTTGNIIHEIGHAIGLRHEHTRADRDNYISIVYDNIILEKQPFFSTVDGESILTEYDYGSIMHYGANQFSANGGRTIITPDGVNIGQRNRLSEGDLKSVNALYGADLALTSSYADLNTNRTELTINIQNIGAVGAHSITTSIPLTANPQSIAAQGTKWDCVQTAADYQCTIPTLGPNQSVDLLFHLDLSAKALAERMLWVLSKTHDTDLANNGNFPDDESDYDYSKLTSDRSSSITAVQALVDSLEMGTGVSTNDQSEVIPSVTQLGAISIYLFFALGLFHHKVRARMMALRTP